MIAEKQLLVKDSTTVKLEGNKLSSGQQNDEEVGPNKLALIVKKGYTDFMLMEEAEYQEMMKNITENPLMKNELLKQNATYINDK